MKRLWRHLTTAGYALRRAFPQRTLDAITAAVREAETQHDVQIRFVVEAALSPSAVIAGQSSRARAIDVFAIYRVWDTADNDGVLIYVLLADRAVEIVADRGVAHGSILSAEWQSACALMQTHFAARRFEEGAIAGIRAATEVLARHAANRGDGRNELPDAPLLLR